MRRAARGRCVGAGLIAAGLALVFSPQGAAAETRRCGAVIVITDGINFKDTSPRFLGQGADKRPNRARRKARDALIRCARAHFENARLGRPEIPTECTSAYGVTEYALEDPITRARSRICAGRTGPLRVNITVFTGGGRGCGARREKTDEWVVAERFQVMC